MSIVYNINMMPLCLADLFSSPQFGSEPLHAAVVHHYVLFQEGKLLILHLGVFSLKIKPRFVSSRKTKTKISSKTRFYLQHCGE